MKTTANLLKRVLSQPTAPFREKYVLEEIECVLQENQLSYFFDEVGNLVAGASSIKELKRTPRIVLFAHTDHPGFLVKRQISPRRLEAVWLGGGPFSHMRRAKVRVFSPDYLGNGVGGWIEKIDQGPYKRTGRKMTIVLDSKETSAKKIIPRGAFGAFDFVGYRRNGHTVITRAADDLGGCVMALGALLDARGEARKRLACVFTRAEEVGFIGCLALVKKYRFHPNSFGISLEASRTLPGAELGKGPVLRLGDRTTLFDNDISQFLWMVAKNLELISKRFQFQRRIMDGGSCEATALNLFGLRCAGVAVPLGNYHNQGENGPAPEKIDIRDIENARKFLVACASQYQHALRPHADLVRSLMSDYRKLSPLLGRTHISFKETSI